MVRFMGNIRNKNGSGICVKKQKNPSVLKYKKLIDKYVEFYKFHKSRLELSEELDSNTKEAIFVINNRGAVLYSNKAAIKLQDKASGKNKNDFFRVFNISRKEILRLESIEREINKHLYRFSFSSIKDRSGLQVGFLAVAEDVDSSSLKKCESFQEKFRNSFWPSVAFSSKRNILYCNQTFFEMSGAKNKAVLYSGGFSNVFQKETAEKLYGLDFKKGDTVKIKTRGGKEFYWKVMYFEKCRKSGAEIFLAAFDDITEKILKSLQILSKDKKYLNLFNSVEVPMCFTDADGRIKEANRAFLEMGGKRFSLIKNIPIRDLFLPPDKFSPPFDRFPAECSFVSGESRFVCKSSAHKDALGNTSGYIFSFLDLEPIKKYDKAREEHFRTLQTIIDSMNAVLIVSDFDGNVHMAGKRIRDLFGYDEGCIRKEGLKMFFKDILGYELYLEHIKDSCDRMLFHPFEFKMKKSDGSILITENTIVPFDRNNSVPQVLIAIKDITAAKNREKEKKDEERHAHKMDAIGRLISGIAHDLNNPLASIYGFSHLLMENNKLNRDVKEDIKMIAQSSSQARYIVENLLRFVRKESVKDENFKIWDCLNSVLSLLAYQIRKSSVTVEKHEDPNINCTGKFQEIQQLFYNIINNAVDALSAVPPEKRLIRIKTAAVNGYARTEIFDNGPRIEPGLAEKIFEPFYTTKEVGKGTGLGLSLCKQIAIEHKGFIYCDANEQKGAKFIVDLPLSETSERISGLELSNSAKVSGKNILVADDEKNILSLVVKTLKGNNLKTVEKLEDLRREIFAKSYDLVISDMSFPDGNCLDFYREMKKFPCHFLFITAGIIGNDDFSYLQGRGELSLQKPFSPAELLKAVSILLK